MKNIDYINLHTHSISFNKRCLDIVNISLLPPFKENRDVEFCSVGVHPWDIDIEQSMDLETEYLKFQASHAKKNIIAIGESGLDRLCDVSFSLQKKWFIKHIELSCSLKLPLIIHCVKASSDIIALHKQYQQKYSTLPAWIIHGFNSKVSVAEEFVRHGIFLSLNNSILKNKKKMVELLEVIPLEYIFLETDNEVYSIVECYEILSSFVLTDNVYEGIKKGFNKLFYLNIN
jgi:TatD DNase family protein